MKIVFQILKEGLIMKKGHIALLTFLLAWTLLIGLILGWLLADMGLQISGISKPIVEDEDRKKLVPTFATTRLPTRTPLITSTLSRRDRADSPFFSFTFY